MPLWARAFMGARTDTTTGVPWMQYTPQHMTGSSTNHIVAFRIQSPSRLRPAGPGSGDSLSQLHYFTQPLYSYAAWPASGRLSQVHLIPWQRTDRD